MARREFLYRPDKRIYVSIRVEVRFMLKSLALIVGALVVAVAFGFLSAVATATDLGLVVSTAFAALIALTVVFQSAHLFET